MQWKFPQEFKQHNWPEKQPSLLVHNVIHMLLSFAKLQFTGQFAVTAGHAPLLISCAETLSTKRLLFGFILSALYYNSKFENIICFPVVSNAACFLVSESSESIVVYSDRDRLNVWLTVWDQVRPVTRENAQLFSKCDFVPRHHSRPTCVVRRPGLGLMPRGWSHERLVLWRMDPGRWPLDTIPTLHHLAHFLSS